MVVGDFMTTKEQVLKELEYNRDIFISGQDLAKKLNISRTAVWKAIDSLRNDGFVIHSTTNKGYRLSNESDKLTEVGIRKNLESHLKNMALKVFDEIDSTNTEAKRMLCSQNVDDFTALVADEQTQGRGRRGKSFSSPKGTGIYISFIIKPTENFDLSYFDLVTIRAAVAIMQTIESFIKEDIGVKWVNDIYLRGKKVCGILSELDADFESMAVNSVIVGIGVNFKTPQNGFDEAIRNIAGGVDLPHVSRNEFTAKLVNIFYRTYYEMTCEDVLALYRKHSVVLNRRVSFQKNGIDYEGTAIDINERGNLVVETEEGIVILSSGEISIQGDFLKS